MKIYLCGPCDSENRTTMVEVSQTLRKEGYKVYCPFELKIENAWDMSQEKWAQKVFDKDIEAINSCDMIFMISLGRISSAGTNWEQGYAYAKNKPVYVFQITDNPTSLMTYCGCNYFINTDRKNLSDKIRQIVDYIKNKCDFNKEWQYCKTILT